MNGTSFNTSTAQLPIRDIQVCPDIQARVSVNQDTIDEYADAIRAGAEFPSVVVFRDGKQCWLAGGFHRLPAHKAAGRTYIGADIRQGDKRDAILFAVGDNARHGLRRSNDDKRRAVRMLLEDDEWFQWSDREIASRCMVSYMLVATIRREVQGERKRPDSSRRGSNGKSYNMQRETFNVTYNRVCLEKVAKRIEQVRQKIGTIREPDEHLSEVSRQVDEILASALVKIGEVLGTGREP